MITLTLGRSGAGAPSQIHRFPGQETIAIGRSAGNDLQIPDNRVSGLHGQIFRRSQGWAYRDLRSTNGSLRVRADSRTVIDGDETCEVPIQDGDLLLLGDVEDPVVLIVAIDPEPMDRPAEGTIVARRSMENAAELSQLHLGVEPGAQVAKLVDLLRRIGGQDDVQAVTHHVGTFLLDRLPAATRVVLVSSDANDPPLVLGRRDEAPQPAKEGTAPYPRGLVAQAMESGQAMLSTDELAVDASESFARLGAAAALVVPLCKDTRRFGALCVTGGPSGFAEEDLDVALAVAYQVSSCFAVARLVKRLRAVERRLRDENRFLKAQIERDDLFSDIIGSAPPMQAVFSQMRLVMDTDATVLVTGETGTGKELVARALHQKSRRGQRLFAPVNCAALSENLLESELFGHVKGAFTGAHENKKGLFQVAHGGTLFLDEIGELSPKLQAKLLRVLQEGEVTPVGTTRPVRVDVRIICATHRDLRAETRGGGFREDLFYRINVFPIRLPALRERTDDIPALAQFFLERYSKQFRKRIPGLTEAAAEKLKRHDFPGNIRELENEIQRAVLLTPDGEPIDAAVFSAEIQSPTGPATGLAAVPIGPLKRTMEALERQVLEQALEEHGWNRSAAARTLGISRQALMVKLSKYELVPD